LIRPGQWRPSKAQNYTTMQRQARNPGVRRNVQSKATLSLRKAGSATQLCVLKKDLPQPEKKPAPEKEMPTSRGGGQVKGGVALGSDVPLGDGRRRLSRSAYVEEFLRITSPEKPSPSVFLIFFAHVAQIGFRGEKTHSAIALHSRRATGKRAKLVLDPLPLAGRATRPKAERGGGREACPAWKRFMFRASESLRDPHP
jgi:hypothetical protein